MTNSSEAVSGTLSIVKTCFERLWGKYRFLFYGSGIVVFQNVYVSVTDKLITQFLVSKTSEIFNKHSSLNNWISKMTT